MLFSMLSKGGGSVCIQGLNVCGDFGSAIC